MSADDQALAIIQHGSAAALERLISGMRQVPWSEYLVEAVKRGKLSHVRAILADGRFIQSRNYTYYLRQAAQAAYLNDQNEILEKLFEHGANNENDILILAVERNDLEMAKRMISYGASNLIEAVSYALDTELFDLAIEMIKSAKEYSSIS